VYWRLSRAPDNPARSRLAGWIGVTALYVSLEWPLGPLAAGYLASVHALQFLIVALIAPPLILVGTRHSLAARWPKDGATAKALKIVLHPLLAAIGFNIVVVATHIPGVNDSMMTSQLGAFAIDAAWLIAGLWFWWGIVVPVPERPLFAVPLKMVYLFLGAMAHTGIAIVMLVTQHPMYGIYELAPRMSRLSAIDDLRLAGGIMELGGAVVIFGVLSAMFFRWSGGVGAERNTEGQ